MSPLKVYMGWDSRESAAYSVASFSITRRTSKPVVIDPLIAGTLESRRILMRPILHGPGLRMIDGVTGTPMSTQFAFSRFAIPLLQQDGWALFCDCDMLFTGDVAKLFELADDKYAVMVVKHDYAPSTKTKMDDQVQAPYPRKNWSSLVLWNCSHPAHDPLGRGINSWPGLDLHQFKWLDDELIGDLPKEWNWLVNEYPDKPASEVSNLHFTLGGPWFANHAPSIYDDLWRTEREIMDCWLRGGPR